MNGRDLLEGLGYIADRFVEEAETACVPCRNNTYRWRSLVAMAACVGLALGGLWLTFPRDRAVANTAVYSGARENEMENDRETAAFCAGEQSTVADAAGTIIWNEWAADSQWDRNAVIPEDAVEGIYGNSQAFELLGGECLPDVLLDMLELEDSEHRIWENPDGRPVDHLLYLDFSYGEDLKITAQPAEGPSIPVNDDSITLEGCMLYPVEEESISTVGGCDVFFCESTVTAADAERTACLTIKVPGVNRYVMLKLYTETLTREEMETAVAQIIEFGR